jgi:hypothetical protein
MKMLHRHQNGSECVLRFEVLSAVVLRVMTVWYRGTKVADSIFTASSLERNESIRNIIISKGRNPKIQRPLTLDVNTEYIYGLFHDACNELKLLYSVKW